VISENWTPHLNAHKASAEPTITFHFVTNLLTHIYKHVQIFFACQNFEMHFFFHIFFNNINESIFLRTFKNIFIKLDIIYKHSSHLWGFLKNQIVFINLICCYSFQSCSIEIREKLIMFKSFMILLCAQRALILFFNVMENSNKIRMKKMCPWCDLICYYSSKWMLIIFPIGYQKIKTNIYNLKI
jgi:hypothetical protein